MSRVHSYVHCSMMFNFRCLISPLFTIPFLHSSELALIPFVRSSEGNDILFTDRGQKVSFYIFCERFLLLTTDRSAQLDAYHVEGLNAYIPGCLQHPITPPYVKVQVAILQCFLDVYRTRNLVKPRSSFLENDNRARHPRFHYGKLSRHFRHTSPATSSHSGAVCTVCFAPGIASSQGRAACGANTRWPLNEPTS